MPSKPGRRLRELRSGQIRSMSRTARQFQGILNWRSVADGRVHIVWSEEVSPGQWEIRYSSCYGNSCNPPKSLSIAGAETCQPLPKQQDWPAIAVDPDGIVGIAWNAGGLIAYTISKPGETPTASTGICFEPAQGPNLDLQPRLAAGEAGQFSLVYGTGNDEASGPIHVRELSARTEQDRILKSARVASRKSIVLPIIYIWPGVLLKVISILLRMLLQTRRWRRSLFPPVLTGPA